MKIRNALLVLVLLGCGPTTGKEITISDPDRQKIHFDLSELNEEGLRGPPDGLRSLTYEFCVPADPKYVDEVKSIDPTAQVVIGSPGRIQCPPEQYLVMGNTHQENFRFVLFNLARFGYIQSIEESFFEE